MADYSNLVNKAGTIYNTSNNVGYSTPDQLAADLGIASNQIDWSQIKTDPNYNTTQNYNLMNQGVNYDSSTQKAIPADSLQGGQQAIVVPQSTLTSTQADASVAGAGTASKSLDAYIKDLTPPPTAEQTQSDTLSKQLMELVGQDTGKVQALQTAEANAGVPELKKQLGDINSQVLTGNAEYKQLQEAYNKISVDNRGKPITMNSIIGNEAQINYARNSELNTKAADINLLVARGQALQGNITAAEATAQKAVDLKYAAIEDQIAVKQAQLKILEPILTKQEKIQADALNLMYQDQKNKIANAKATEKQIQTMAIQAASGGAPQTLVDKAILTKDPVQAASILQQYLKGPTESTSSTGNTQGTLFKVPTAKELGGMQFYKYPTSSIVYSSNGTALSLQQFKDATGQSAVPDAQVNFNGIKTINPTSTSPGDTPVKQTISGASSTIRQAWQDQGYIQGNGKISSTDYKEGKIYWTTAPPNGLGFTATQYDSQFSGLIDKTGSNWRQDYNYSGI